MSESLRRSSQAARAELPPDRIAQVLIHADRAAARMAPVASAPAGEVEIARSPGAGAVHPEDALLRPARPQHAAEVSPLEVTPTGAPTSGKRALGTPQCGEVRPPATARFA